MRCGKGGTRKRRAVLRYGVHHLETKDALTRAYAAVSVAVRMPDRL